MRKAKIKRVTNETKISVNINLDGTGKSKINTGIAFFDHMLEQLAKHSLIDIEISADGDLQIDDHHTVEDTGITLGKAIKLAVKEKVGIHRYGTSLLPMDEALVQTAIDICGRPHFECKLAFTTPKIGTFDVELVNEFFNALAFNSEINLHIIMLAGGNSHHIAEATFKSVARSLRLAVEKDVRNKQQIPSTKGVI